MSLGYLYPPSDGGGMMSKGRIFSIVATFLLVLGGSNGCFGASEDASPNVLFVTTASEVRARFVVIDELSSVAVVKGLTPDTVALSGTRAKNVKAKYRVDIIHPDTGEVYSVRVEGKRNLVSGWEIDTTEIKAPF